MATHPSALDVELCNLKSNSFWKEAYPLLQSFARLLVYTSHVPFWKGQESEFIEDIVQETCRRIIERSQKEDRDEAAPVQSLKKICCSQYRTTTAKICAGAIDANYEHSNRIHSFESIATGWPDNYPRKGGFLNLLIGQEYVEAATPLQNLMVNESLDLLGRLFSSAQAILVEALASGFSGTGVLKIRPFFAERGGGRSVVVKCGRRGESQSQCIPAILCVADPKQSFRSPYLIAVAGLTLGEFDQ